jgi:hypothetical protein
MPEGSQGRGAKAAKAKEPKAKQPKAKGAKATSSIEAEFDALDAANAGADFGGGTDGESDAESDESSSAPATDSRVRREERDAKCRQTRARQLARRPGPMIAAMRYRAQDNWPYARTACSARVAPDWLVDMSADGRLRKASEDWRRAIGATRHKQLAVHSTLCEAIDQMVVHDGWDVVNSAGVEVLVRHCVGLELAFEEVQCEDDWKDPKTSLVRWEELNDFDVVRACRPSRVAPQALEEVRQTRERRHKADLARARAADRKR